MKYWVVLMALLTGTASSAYADSAILRCDGTNNNTTYKIVYPLVGEVDPIFISLQNQDVYLTKDNGSTFESFFIGVFGTTITYSFDDAVLRNPKEETEFVGSLYLDDGDADGNPIHLQFNCQKIEQ